MDSKPKLEAVKRGQIASRFFTDLIMNDNFMCSIYALQNYQTRTEFEPLEE